MPGLPGLWVPSPRLWFSGFYLYRFCRCPGLEPAEPLNCLLSGGIFIPEEFNDAFQLGDACGSLVGGVLLLRFGVSEAAGESGGVFSRRRCCVLDGRKGGYLFL